MFSSSLASGAARSPLALFNAVATNRLAVNLPRTHAVPQSRTLVSLDKSRYEWRHPSLEGQRSLRTVLGITPAELGTSEERFIGHVQRANRLLGADPAGVLAKLGCTRSDIIGLAQAFHHAAAQRRFETQTPEMLSLMYHLLSACTVESTTVAGLSRFVGNLVGRVACDADLQQALLQWPTLPRAQRRAALQEGVAHIPLALKGCGMSPRDLSRDVTVEFKPGMPLAMASVSYGGAYGVSKLEFSEHLLETEPHALAQEMPGLEGAHSCAAGLFFVLASHEFIHVLQQQQAMRRSMIDKPTPQDWFEAIADGLSRETESGIVTRQLDTHEDHRSVLPHLPHEMQAWLASVFVSRAWSQQQLSGHALLLPYLVNTFENFAALFWKAEPPRPFSKNGTLWDDQGALRLLPPADPYPREQLRAWVERLVQPTAQLLPVKSSPPARPVPR